MVTLYSTGCPRCNVLKKKLEQMDFQYQVNESVDEMLSLGIRSAPMLDTGDGNLLDFTSAINWLNQQ